MGGRASKIKGNGFEREIVNRAKEQGLDCSRSWASDGRSRGMAKEVDLVLQGRAMQCKRIKQLPKWIGLTDKIDGAILREDHGSALVLIRLEDYFELLKSESRDLFWNKKKEKENVESNSVRSITGSVDASLG